MSDVGPMKEQIRQHVNKILKTLTADGKALALAKVLQQDTSTVGLYRVKAHVKTLLVANGVRAGKKDAVQLWIMKAAFKQKTGKEILAHG